MLRLLLVLLCACSGQLLRDEESVRDEQAGALAREGRGALLYCILSLLVSLDC